MADLTLYTCQASTFILSTPVWTRGPTIHHRTTRHDESRGETEQNKSVISSLLSTAWQLKYCFQVMKTLASSFSKIILHKNGDRPLFSSGELRHEISFFQSKKLAHKVGFCLCVKHKPICTTRVSSSLSPQSQACTLFFCFSLALFAYGVNLGTGDDQNQETNESKTVRVKFQLQKECSFGEQFTIVGDDPLLGLWDPESVIPMNWSDEHLWTVELDIPVGKSFQFKFILKGIGGKICWQPGPDRILQTWETDNTIVVWEDWEDAALQKVTEEEPSVDGTEEPTVNPEMLIVTENLTHQKEKLVSEASKGGVTMNVSANPEKKPAPVTYEKRIVADNISPMQEKPVAIVADNIRYSEGLSDVNVSANLEKKPAPVTYEKRIVADNISPMQEKPVAIVADNMRCSEGPSAVNVSANPEKKPAPVTYEKRIVADNISPMQEKPVAIVADNIRCSEGPSAVNVSDEVLVEKRASHPEEEQSTTSNKSTLIREDVRNDDAPTIINSAKSDVQGSVVAHEGDPILLPDLSAVSVLPSEAANDDEGERSRAIYASVGINEVENHNVLEFDEKHESGDNPLGEETVNGFIDELKHNPQAREGKRDTDDSPHREETVNGFNDEEQHGYELIYKPLGQEEKKQEMVRNSVVQNDLHWIKKLLTNLGFL
ncbi:hypothetical protein SADUNF_Sadunf06G0077500 [Salix dunnii]|uniref:CBM20 domain-containing protein n=1 Tax=Salix dunnii TaxID=1413687 RepID=A0A835K1G9_9ROSI|nr:hypothetical protein SADUNF_Sadunf06G0077500 [Salix dunnii]